MGRQGPTPRCAPSGDCGVGVEGSEPSEAGRRMTDDRSFQEGYAASRYGVDPEDNPRIPQTDEHSVRDEGWSQTQREEAGTSESESRNGGGLLASCAVTSARRARSFVGFVSLCREQHP